MSYRSHEHSEDGLGCQPGAASGVVVGGGLVV